MAHRSFSLGASSITRRTAAIGAAAFVGAAAMFGSLPASAQQTAKAPLSSSAVSLDTDCSKFKPTETGGDVECKIIKLRLIEAQNACIAELVKFKKASPDKFKELGFGTITRDNACTFVGRLPKQSADLR